MTVADDVTRHIQALGASMTSVRDLTLSQAWYLVEGYALDGTIPGLTIPAVQIGSRPSPLVRQERWLPG